MVKKIFLFILLILLAGFCFNNIVCLYDVIENTTEIYYGFCIIKAGAITGLHQDGMVVLILSILMGTLLTLFIWILLSFIKCFKK